MNEIKGLKGPKGPKRPKGLKDICVSPLGRFGPLGPFFMASLQLAGMIMIADEMTVQQLMGKYHALFFLFPLGFFCAALVMDILHYFGKRWVFVIGHGLVIAGVVMCVPTILTGMLAAQNYDLQDLIVAKHRTLGYSTGICGSLYAGLRISAMCWKLPLSPTVYIYLSVLLVALVFWTSDYGALLVTNISA